MYVRRKVSPNLFDYLSPFVQLLNYCLLTSRAKAIPTQLLFTMLNSDATNTS